MIIRERTSATIEDLELVDAILRGRRSSEGWIVIDDLQNIEQAVRAGVIPVKIFSNEDRLPSNCDVPVVEITRTDARRLFADERSSRTFAIARTPRPARLEDLVDRRGDVIVLDGVRLMGNIGAVIRSSVAMGGAGVVLLGSGLRTVMDRRLIRASRGLVFGVPVVVSQPDVLGRFCVDQSIPLYLADRRGGLSIDQLRHVGHRMVIAFGGERHGASTAIRALATETVTIETASEVESLNVSVAAGIALFCRQRHNLDSGQAHGAALHH